MLIGIVAIFVLKRSILFRKRMRAEFLNQCELAIDSQSIRASCIWFYKSQHQIYEELEGRAYSILILCQTLIIPTNRNQEQESVNILKAMYPLLAFRSLATDIEHAIL